MKRFAFFVFLVALLIFGSATPGLSADTFSVGPTLAYTAPTNPVGQVRPEYRKYIAAETGSGALSETLEPGFHFKLVEIRLHLNSASATSEYFSASVDSADGAVYDAKLFAEDMNGDQDCVWAAEGDVRLFRKTDKITFSWANSNSRTWGLTVVLLNVENN